MISKLKNNIVNFLNIFTDLLYSAVLSFISILLFPFILFLGTSFSHIIHLIKVLLPMGLLSYFLKLCINFKLGRYSLVCSKLEELISVVKNNLDEASLDVKDEKLQLLFDLYSFLAYSYLAQGNIESASDTLIKANAVLGVKHLDNMYNFDVSTAYIVKNSILATKYLEEESYIDNYSSNNKKSTFDRKDSKSKDNKKPECQIIRFPKNST